MAERTRGAGSAGRPPSVLIANPSADVYGADLQLLESITGLVDAGATVRVCVASDGPLVPMLRARGAAVQFVASPVVRRSALSSKGLAALVGGNLTGVARLVRLLRRLRPDVVLVNTVTIPAWIAAARIARVPVLVHVHEAEDSDNRWVLKGLLAPLLGASGLIVNSKAAAAALTSVYPRLHRRISLIYNGIPDVPPAPAPPTPDPETFRLAAVCRLSPRKAPDVAIEAVALLRTAGVPAVLTIYGTPFAGYEWYQQQLKERAAQPDLAGAVTLAGYVSPIWEALAAADAVLAPSLREPFGNAVVEAQFARRPVVAAAAMGHLETVNDGETGLLVEPGDAAAMAAAVQRLIDDPALAARLAERGRQRAVERFSVHRYRRDIAGIVLKSH